MATITEMKRENTGMKRTMRTRFRSVMRELDKKYPDYKFEKIDFTSQKINCPFNPGIILCMDVTQHIVEEKKFDILMYQLKGFIDHGAVLIITDHLVNKKYGFYEVGRQLSSYKRIFNDCIIKDPERYRDKWIFSILKEPV